MSTNPSNDGDNTTDLVSMMRAQIAAPPKSSSKTRKYKYDEYFGGHPPVGMGVVVVDNVTLEVIPHEEGTWGIVKVRSTEDRE